MNNNSVDPSFLPNRDHNDHLGVGSILVQRYQILDIVGVGGMGSVYRAKDLHFSKIERLVAIKELVIQTGDTEIRNTIIQNFEREANILALLEHPSIPKIYDAFSESDRSFLVMELVSGHDLESLIERENGFFAEEQILDWAIQLCDVLNYLHHHQPAPIIFRDMKPSNVMVNDKGRIILVDFGIAKPFQTGQKGTMIGTEGYSSPEQYRGEATPQTDIYSLGATLHHLITKKDPRNEPPFSFTERPVRKYNPAITNELEKVIQNAVSYEAAKRFATVDGMRSALISAGKKTGLLNRSSSSFSNQPTQFSANTFKPLWTYKCVDEIRGSAVVGNGNVYFGCYDKHLYAVDATTGSLNWKFATKGGIVSKPLLAERQLLFGSEDGFVYSLEPATSKQLWTYQTSGAVRSSGYAADGHLFIGSDDGFLHVINIASGKQAWVHEVTDPIRSSPAVLGNRVYFGSEAGDMLCLNFRGQVAWKFRAKRAITSSPWVEPNLTFFTSIDSYLYAVDSTSGWLIWRYRLDRPSISSPIVVDNMVLVGSSSGFLISLDVRNGREIWKYRTEGQISGSFAAYHESIYFGSVDGAVYNLDIRTGKLNWRFTTRGPITGTPAVHDGVVFIGSTDHTMYAFTA